MSGQNYANQGQKLGKDTAGGKPSNGGCCGWERIVYNVAKWCNKLSNYSH